MMDRYSRQIAFAGIGKEGQEKLLKSRVTVIGLGALGSASANLLARAGVGFLRLIDSDRVEYSNLQRQMLYREEDAASFAPKAQASAELLRRINSEITIEPVIARVDGENIGQWIDDVDLVIDATDNVSTRLIINQACHEGKIPWVFGGVAASFGMTMNLLHGEDDPCYRCLWDGEEEGDTAATAGILGTLTSVTASLQCTEALKILIGSPDVRKTLLAYDIWTNEMDEMEICRQPGCPVCGR